MLQAHAQMTYEIDYHYRNGGPEAELWITGPIGVYDELIATFYGKDALAHAEMFKALLENKE